MRPVWKPVLISTILSVLLLTVMALTLRQAASSAKPAGYSAADVSQELTVVPDFQLTKRSGEAVGRDDLLGKVWLAGFIFTRCHHTCPMVTGVMARLRSELPPEVQMVSISVDPEYDTPQVLAEYARDYDPQSWWFLTGKQSDVYSLIRNGFKLGVQQNGDASGAARERVTHSTRLALVDKRGSVRAYFDCSDAAQIDLIPRRVGQLLKESL